MEGAEVLALGPAHTSLEAASLGHDKARGSDKGAKEASCVRPGTGVLMDDVLDVPLNSGANVLVTKECQAGVTLEHLSLIHI